MRKTSSIAKFAESRPLHKNRFIYESIQTFQMLHEHDE